MRVRCITDDPLAFPPEVTDGPYYDEISGGDRFSYADVERISTVYAITNWTGRPMFFIYSRQFGYDAWRFVPALCFEILDARLSQYWHWQHIAGGGALLREHISLGVQEWMEDPMFLEDLLDNRAERVRAWWLITARLDAEFSEGNADGATID